MTGSRYINIRLPTRWKCGNTDLNQGRGLLNGGGNNMKKNNYKTFQNDFNSIVQNKIPVTGCKYDHDVSEIIGSVDDFRQCYKNDDPVRESFPRYWFISREGFLITVRNPKEPQWIKPNLSASRPEFKISMTDQTKTISTYTLVALVWNSYRTIDAQKIFADKGYKALGRLKKKDGQHEAIVQCHHIKGYIKEQNLQNYIANNNPENLQLITVREHNLIHSWKEKYPGAMIFYQPSFQNVPHDHILILDENTHEILDPTTLQIIPETCTIYSIMPLEKDSFFTDKYCFILQDGREFLEQNKKILDVLADQYPPQYADPRYNKPLDFNDHTIYYCRKGSCIAK